MKKSWVPIKKLQRNDRAATSFSSIEQQNNKPHPPSFPPSTMEHQKNKIHPSLPSNYVTLAQLQDRWLKQKNQINQQQKDDEEEEKQQKQREEKEEEKQVPVAVATPTNGILSRSHSPSERQQEEKQFHVAVVAATNGNVSRSRPAQEQHRRKNRIGSTSKRRTEEAAFEYRRKLENGAGIRENRPKSESGSGIGQNRLKSEIGGKQEEEKQVTDAVAVVAPTSVTVSRSNPAPERQRRQNRSDKRRTDDAASENRQKLENGAGIGEKHLKSETEAVIEEKHLKLETGAEIGENRLESEIGDGIGDENAGLNGEPKKEKNKRWKKKWKGKMKPKVEEEKGGIENGTVERENEVADKTTIESELNDKKNVQSLTVEKVEEKFGDLSLDPKNGKQNGKFSRVKNGFRESQSQFQSKYRGGGGGGGGGGYGRFRDQRRFGDQRRFNSSSPMIWVKKDGGDGEIER